MKFLCTDCSYNETYLSCWSATVL